MRPASLRFILLLSYSLFASHFVPYDLVNGVLFINIMVILYAALGSIIIIIII